MMKTKDRILDVARKMIAEVGFHSTTTALLAQKAGISEGTIYRHFASKDDILVTILDELDERYSEFITQLKTEGDGHPGTIERVLEANFKFVAEHLEGIKIVLSSFALLPPSRRSMNSVIDRMRTFAAESIVRSMELGVIRQVDPERTAMVLVALLLGLLELRLYWPENTDINAEAVAFCRQALVKIQ
ncbi:MAG: TetR/AcrR family transcriptional regulator [Proteobacteria bacterium]|nr:TetR/AcrR family transcriptional regulator [Pseudomonadota bacterium]MBU1612068.1 TetR/AcrR family transcriptional regulator [Pseudomonadota bacterium]